MCLFTRLGEARTADKDITCYKVVHPGDRWKMPSNVFKSVVMDFQYKLGVTYEEPKFKTTPVFDENSAGGFVYKGFHSYRKLSVATYWTSKWNVILKCVIPAGSKYYYDPDKNQYCSNKLKVIAWRQPFMKPRVWSTEQRTDADAVRAYNKCN